MINVTELKPGDLLLLKKEKDIIHKYIIENFGTMVENMLTGLTGQEYLHSELYLGEGWVLSATVNGVKLNKYSTDTLLKNFDIFRPQFKIDQTILLEQIKESHNKRYDFISLYLNVIDTIGQMFGKKFEFPYDTNFMLICSELIARIYEKMGATFHESLEYITPQDLADSNMFKQI
jgi:hypothetical protein